MHTTPQPAAIPVHVVIDLESAIEHRRSSTHSRGSRVVIDGRVWLDDDRDQAWIQVDAATLVEWSDIDFGDPHHPDNEDDYAETPLALAELLDRVDPLDLELQMAEAAIVIADARQRAAYREEARIAFPAKKIPPACGDSIGLPSSLPGRGDASMTSAVGISGPTAGASARA